MRRAVVTGATGVVGSALVRELNRRGIEVLALLRAGSPNNARIPEIAGENAEPYSDSDTESDTESSAEGTLMLSVRNAADTPLWNNQSPVHKVECSLDQMKNFAAQYEGNPYDVFFHLGWGGTKGKSRFDPYIHNKNVEYALDAVALAKRLGCTGFIGAGSQAEYGRSDETLTPATPTHPENAYGIAKLCAGQMTREYAHTLGMRHAWTRILSVYGPNDGGKTLVTYMVNELLAGRRPETTAGEQIWDFLYADDAARALCMIGDKLAPDGCTDKTSNVCDGKTYLIASGQERTLRSYIEELRDIVSPGAEIGFGEKPYAPRQVMHLAADISQTTADTGWKPEIPFGEGIRRMVSFGKM